MDKAASLRGETDAVRECESDTALKAGETALPGIFDNSTTDAVGEEDMLAGCESCAGFLWGSVVVAPPDFDDRSFNGDGLRALRAVVFAVFGLDATCLGLSGTRVRPGGGVPIDTGETINCWSINPCMTSGSFSKVSKGASGNSGTGFVRLLVFAASVVDLRLAFRAESLGSGGSRV